MKLVINNEYGGFGLSPEAEKLYKEYSGEDINYWIIKRDNENLIRVVEELGEEANGTYAHLAVVEIPDNAYFFLEEFDGYEYVIYSMTPLFKVIGNE